jgi:hypothetical protein
VDQGQEIVTRERYEAAEREREWLYGVVKELCEKWCFVMERHCGHVKEWEEIGGRLRIVMSNQWMSSDEVVYIPLDLLFDTPLVRHEKILAIKREIQAEEAEKQAEERVKRAAWLRSELESLEKKS